MLLGRPGLLVIEKRDEPTPVIIKPSLVSEMLELPVLVILIVCAALDPLEVMSLNTICEVLVLTAMSRRASRFSKTLVMDFCSREFLRLLDNTFSISLSK